MADNNSLRVSKPWGFEEILEKNDDYVLKKLTMFKGHRCSLQYHEEKRETIFVVSGLLGLETGPHLDRLTFEQYSPGDCFTLDPLKIHRMSAIEDCVYLEASTPELHDVVRLQDDYNR